MLLRNPKNVQKLDVHDLNSILVLLDRSETRLCEIGINTWPAGKIGPGHVHAQKEQIFFVLAGKGHITVSEKTWSVSPYDLIYVPPGCKHQTMPEGTENLTYLLYNGFLDEKKEGHASFAAHIEKVKDTRKAQAQGIEIAHSCPTTNKEALYCSFKSGAFEF